MVPDRFRWELGQPAQTIALRQPDQLLIIYPRLKRVEKYPLRAAQPGPWKDALALLDASFPRSRADLESHFRVLSVTETNSMMRVTLQPKSASARKFMAEIQVSCEHQRLFASCHRAEVQRRLEHAQRLHEHRDQRAARARSCLTPSWIPTSAWSNRCANDRHRPTRSRRL